LTYKQGTTVDKPPQGFEEHVRKMDMGKEKSTTTVKDKGEKKMWEL
jgi:hypothetical protein